MKKKINVVLKQIILLPIAVLFAFPFLWMVFGIFKTNNEIWQKPYQLLPSHWNFKELFQSLEQIHFETYILNSFVVGIIGTFIMLLITLFFTYTIVFMKSKWTDLLFFAVMATYMLPGAVTYVPSYVILAELGLLDTLRGLMFTYFANVFVVFYLRQSFMKTGKEYLEAARIDGAGHFKIIRHVVFPLNKSALITVFVLTFIQQYNNYMWPSIMLKSQSKYLISQGLRQFFIQDGAYGMNWSQIMLASTVTILPVLIVFIVGQKWFISGIAHESGIK